MIKRIAIVLLPITGNFKQAVSLLWCSTISEAIILQRINLLNVLNYNLWSYSQAVLSACMGSAVFIQLSGMENVEKTFVKKIFK
jgi:hypothetical protein